MAHADDIAAMADAAVARLKLDLKTIVDQLQAYLTKLLEQAEVDADGNLLATSANAELAAKLLADFSRILRELGWDDAAGKLLTTFEEVAKANGAYLQDTLGVSFSSANREALASFVSGVADELVHLEGLAGAKLREVMLLGATTHVPRGQIILDLAHAAGVTLREALTEADTAIMAFHREALESTAEDAGFDLFVYVGPDDEVVRPFCEAHVRRIYTTRDLDQEDNGQGLWPTSRFLGGYRCRHSLAPITLETAQAMVVSNGDRIIGGRQARRIVLGGRPGPNEAAYIARNAGRVTVRDGRQTVVRRRKMA